MEAKKLNNLSIAEYLLINDESELKYEFHDGTIVAMAGSSYNHGIIGGNTFAQLNAKLLRKGQSCFPLNSDIRLHIESENRILYPDVMIVCDQVDKSERDAEAVTNPVVIIEVLSKSTEAYDRGDKFYLYRQLPSLRAYILIAQEEPKVEVFTKGQGDLWAIKRYTGLGAIINIESIGVEISLEDVYRNVSF